MKGINRFLAISVFSILPLGVTASARSQTGQDPPKPQNPPAQQGETAAQTPQGGGARRMGLFGKITAIQDQSIQIATPKGDTFTVKINGDTQFRKEPEAAKLSDLNNVFNTVQFTSLGTAVNSITFGEVTGTGNMRRVTAQARFRF